MSNTLQHIGFIMDGNRRWAVKHGMEKTAGHQYGLKNMRDTLQYCRDKDIPYISFWVLAKKNILERSSLEKKVLFHLIEEKIEDFSKDCKKNNIKIEYIGDFSLLPESTKKCLLQAQEYTKDETKCTTIIAIGYGGQDEIVRATKRIIEANISVNELDEATFSRYLDSGKYPEPDLIIRTGGDYRHSGFFLYQSEYAEYAHTSTLWPDYSIEEIEKHIETYEKAKRNFGK